MIFFTCLKPECTDDRNRFSVLHHEFRIWTAYCLTLLLLWISPVVLVTWFEVSSIHTNSVQSAPPGTWYILWPLTTDLEFDTWPMWVVTYNVSLTLLWRTQSLHAWINPIPLPLLSKFNTVRNTGYFLGMQITRFLQYIIRQCINIKLSFVERKWDSWYFSLPLPSLMIVYFVFCFCFFTDVCLFSVFIFTVTF